MNIETIEKKIPLNKELTDFLIITLDFDFNSKKKLIGFCLMQVFYTEEKVIEIIKFDTAHGVCHAHRNYKDKKDSNKINRETFNELKKDVKQNWKTYKRLYINKWLK